jgi:hypothetical protein
MPAPLPIRPFAGPHDPDVAAHREKVAEWESSRRAVETAERAVAEARERCRPGEREARQQLADAIAAASEARRAIEANRVAGSRAAENLRIAEARVATAAAAANQAREASAAAAEHAALTGQAPTSPPASRDLRVRLAEAEDDRDAARTAADRIEAALPKLEETLSVAELNIAELADEVIRAGAPVEEMIAAAAALQGPLIEIRQSLSDLLAGGLAADKELAVRNFLAGTESRTLPGLPADLFFTGWHALPLVLAWKATREALRTDAGAPFPKPPS